MTKFYVSCGAYRCTLTRPTAHEAAKDAFVRLQAKHAAELPHLKSRVRVSEKGFSPHADDEQYLTKQVLEASGLIDRYRSKQ